MSRSTFYRILLLPFFALIGFFALAPICPQNAVAEYIEPSELTVKTEQYIPQHVDFDRGIYSYDVSWQGIPVGSATVAVTDTIRDGAKVCKVTTYAKSAKIISLFYKLRFKGESIFDSVSLKPILFYADQRDRSMERYQEVVFDRNGLIKSIYKKNGKLREKHEFYSENLTLDPITAAFVARSLPLEVGLKREFDIFNGSHRYLITFDVSGRESISIAGRQRDAFRVVPTIEKLTDTKGEDRFKSAAIWISADDQRDVLKMDSKVYFGSIRARMTSFTPEAPDVLVAENRIADVSIK
jgi:hypothetical protein